MGGGNCVTDPSNPAGQAQGITFVGQREKEMASQETISSDTVVSETQHKASKRMY